MINYNNINRLLFAAVVFSVLAACSGEAPPAAGTDSASVEKGGDGFKTIAAVGDSLTAGYGVEEEAAYPARLQDRLVKDGHFFRVVNAGVSGETSSGTRSRIAWVIRSLKPDIVILETGANDGLRGIDPAVLEDNLDAIVAALLAEDIVVVLAGMKMPPNFGRSYTRRFSEVYPRVAKRKGVTLIPFFLEPVAGDRRYNLADGIHPNSEGYRHIVSHIYPYVLDAIEQSTPP